MSFDIRNTNKIASTENKIIVGAIYLALTIIFCASCKQTKVVTVTEYKDSIRTEYHNDSVYIYFRDSIFIREKNDTVLIDKYHIVYRDRISKDTIHATQYIEKPVITTVEIAKRYIPKWVWILIACNMVAAVGFAVKLYLKYKPV